MSDRSRAWEFQLERWHAQYNREGRALVARVHPPAKLVRGHLVYSAKGAPDFMGVLSGGRALVMDAKSVLGASLPFSNIAAHQAAFFSRTTDRGGCAFVCVKFGHGFGWLPWPLIQPRYQTWCRGDGAPASIKGQEFFAIGEDGWLTGEFYNFFREARP